MDEARNRTIHRFTNVWVLICDRPGIAQGFRASFTVGVHADLGPMEASQRVPSVPFHLSLFERWTNDAFRQVVQIDRLALAPGNDVSAHRAILSVPEIEQNPAQLIRDGDEADAALCLGIRFFPVPDRAANMDMLLGAVPFFPSQSACFRGANAGKAMMPTAARATGLPFKAIRIACTSSRVAATVGFAFVTASGRITPSVGFLPGRSPVLMAY
jgi:hypothetical protein